MRWIITQYMLQPAFRLFLLLILIMWR